MSVAQAQIPFTLDKNENILNNTDAEGRHWIITHSPHSTLYYVTSDNSKAACPIECKGLWTKPEYLQEKLTQYVTKTWEKAEDVDKKLDRKRQAAREAKKK